MNKRLQIVIIGIAVISLLLAGLLGVIDALGKTEPLAIIHNQSPKGGLTNENPYNTPSDNESDGTISFPFDISPDGGITPNLLSLDIFTQNELLPHIPLLSVTGASNTSLLRSTVTSIREGNTWKFDPDAEIESYTGDQIPLNIEGYSRKSISEIQVTPLANYPSGTVAIPITQYVSSISSDIPLSYYPEQNLFLSSEGMPENYSFEAVRYSFSETALKNAEINPDEKYLQLPDTITERTRELAKNITQDISSPYLKAKAIEEYLKANYTYDYFYPSAPDGQDVDDWFLFNSQRGVCTNFNSAFVSLSRSAGLPARLVGGYAIEPQIGEQEVSADQAHAWAEVKFKDLGWITFDATGSNSLPLIKTQTEITEVSSVVIKQQSFNVQGTVESSGTVVEGVLVEIFINTQKSQTGGQLVGQGLVSNGIFNIEINLPEDTEVGNYQLLAHAQDSIRFLGSWSDPRIKITSGTIIDIDTEKKIDVSDIFIANGKLTEDLIRPIPGQKIEVLLNDYPVTYLISDQNGIFRWERSFTQPGTYNVKFIYSGNEYYLESSKEVEFQVLIPTILTVSIPSRVAEYTGTNIRGYLLEEITGNAISGQSIELYNEESRVGEGITAGDGRFDIEYLSQKSGSYRLEVRYPGNSYYAESSVNSILEVKSSALSGWILWAILAVAVLIIAGELTYILYRRKYKSRSITVPESVELKHTAKMINSFTNINAGPEIRVNFPQIESPLPNVWGVGEELLIECQLIDGNGNHMARKIIWIACNGQGAQIVTDDKGTGRYSVKLSKKGLYEITVKYIGEGTSGNASAIQNIRIVDYREEIVELYTGLLNEFREMGINLPQNVTHREIEQIFLDSENKIPEVQLNRVTNIFEEADYSLHPISREDYINMFLAQREIKIYGRTLATAQRS